MKQKKHEKRGQAKVKAKLKAKPKLIAKAKPKAKPSAFKMAAPKKVGKVITKRAPKKAPLKKLVRATLPLKKKVMLTPPVAEQPIVIVPPPEPVRPVQLRIPLRKRRVKAADSKTVYVACYRCGKVHLQRSRLEAREEIINFNEFFDRTSPAVKELFGGEHDTLRSYQHCSGCDNSYKLFREAELSDMPSEKVRDVTISPILDRFE